MAENSWLDLPSETLFGLANLPYGIFERPDGTRSACVAIGDQLLDVAPVAAVLYPDFTRLFDEPTLNKLMAAGPMTWDQVRNQLQHWLTEARFADEVVPHLHDQRSALMHLPFAVGDYVDFYSSKHHATNVNAIYRPGGPPLPRNWKHMPVGYHGRAGTLVVSTTAIVRPVGQRPTQDADTPSFGPTRNLDFEAEVAFVVGVGSTKPIPVNDFDRHVFGVCLLNDWSARDLQAFESVPLGPFLGKSFATSLSPWVVSLAALDDARVPPPLRDPIPLPYLRDDARSGFDLQLEVTLNGRTIARPSFAAMYWTAAQQLAHLTVNGASTRTGDVFASGTVSGPNRGQRGSMLELTWGGTEPLRLPDEQLRTWLQDNDTVTISGTAPGPGKTRIGLGHVSGSVTPALPAPADQPNHHSDSFEA